MPSRKVYVRIRPNNTKLPNDVYNEAKRKVSSIFGEGGSPLSGLTREEEEKYLRRLLALEPQDPQFRNAVRQFWTEFSFNVEPGDGTELEVGTDKAGEPLNLEDWIRYKFCLKHVEVAESLEHVTGNRIKYYLHDEQREIDKKYQGLQVKKQARKEHLLAADDPEKTDFILTMFGKNTDNMDSAQKQLALEEFSESDPEKFYNISTDKDLEMKVLIERCISAEVLLRYGNTYMNGDEKLGDSITEAVLYLSDKKNTETLLQLKARLKSFAKIT